MGRGTWLLLSLVAGMNPMKSAYVVRYKLVADLIYAI
jgi:hypothetical protein